MRDFDRPRSGDCRFGDCGLAEKKEPRSDKVATLLVFDSKNLKSASIPFCTSRLGHDGGTLPLVESANDAPSWLPGHRVWTTSFQRMNWTRRHNGFLRR